MQNSILLSIKKLLNVHEDDTNFDQDIIIHLNSVISMLRQLGVGDKPFVITGNSETWTEYLGDTSSIELVKTYMYLKVKLIFDPPTSSVITESINRAIGELEWRILAVTDFKQSPN